MGKKERRPQRGLTDEILAGLKSAETHENEGDVATLLTAGGRRMFDKRASEAGIDLVLYKEVDASGAVDMLKKPADWEVRQLCEKRGIPYIEDYASRVIPYIMSDERVDWHGDIVRQNWIFDAFERNPVMPYCHQWEQPPVGSMLQWGVIERATPEYVGLALAGLGLFATADQCEHANRIFRLVAAGFLKGCSVGFTSMKVTDVKDDEERAQLGLGRYGLILDNNRLLELSPCTLGANMGASSVLVSLNKAAKLAEGDPLRITLDDFTFAREITRRDLLKRRSPGTWISMDNKYVEWARILFPKQGGIARHQDVEEPFEVRDAQATPAPAPQPAVDPVIEVQETDTKQEGDAMLVALQQEVVAARSDIAALGELMQASAEAMQAAIGSVLEIVETLAALDDQPDEQANANSSDDDEKDDEEDKSALDLDAAETGDAEEQAQLNALARVDFGKLITGLDTARRAFGGK